MVVKKNREGALVHSRVAKQGCKLVVRILEYQVGPYLLSCSNYNAIVLLSFCGHQTYLNSASMESKWTKLFVDRAQEIYKQIYQEKIDLLVYFLRNMFTQKFAPKLHKSLIPHSSKQCCHHTRERWLSKISVTCATTIYQILLLY